MDLNDSSLGQWCSDIVTTCFSSEEARCMLSMPLSKFGCGNKLIWHHTKGGVYSVKTGYYIAQDLSRNGELGCKGRGESSAGQGRSKVWSTIWKLDVPYKLRHFIWRSRKNILMVKLNLQRRGIGLPTTCPTCGVAEETQCHMFFHCPFPGILVWDPYSVGFYNGNMQHNVVIEGILFDIQCLK